MTAVESDHGHHGKRAAVNIEHGEFRTSSQPQYKA